VPEKKHKKLKTIFCLLYLLLTFLYIIFIYMNFAQGTYGNGIKIFGCNMYILDSNQTVLVDYSKLPKQGDMVIYEVDGKKKIASVNSISQSNMLFLSVDNNGETKYYNEPMTYGVVTAIIPGISYIYSFLSSFLGIFLIIILPYSVILVFQIINLIKIMLKNKNQISKDKFDFVNSIPMRRKWEKTNSIQKSVNTENQAFNSQMNIGNIESNFPTNDTYLNDDFYDFATTLKYKICFKDNKKISKKLIEPIENSNERLYALNEYGLAATNIEDGVEIKIHPPAVSEITLKLKNDGSLIIDTNVYTANIDMEIK